jgi:hypothetical protein
MDSLEWHLPTHSADMHKKRPGWNPRNPVARNFLLAVLNLIFDIELRVWCGKGVDLHFPSARIRSFPSSFDWLIILFSFLSTVCSVWYERERARRIYESGLPMAGLHDDDEKDKKSKSSVQIRLSWRSILRVCSWGKNWSSTAFGIRCSFHHPTHPPSDDNDNATRRVYVRGQRGGRFIPNVRRAPNANRNKFG